MTCLSPIWARTRRTASVTVSPSAIRRLRIALAWPGSTLGADPPEIIVGAIVVRTIAAGSPPAALNSLAVSLEDAAARRSNVAAAGDAFVANASSILVTATGALTGNVPGVRRLIARDRRLTAV